MSQYRSRRSRRVHATTVRLYEQQFNALIKDLKGKISADNVGRPQEYTLNYLSGCFDNDLLNKIREIVQNKNPAVYPSSVFDMHYIYGTECYELFPFHRACKFLDGRGKQIYWKKSMKIYIEDLEALEPSTSIFEKALKFRNYCLATQQELIQSQLLEQINIVKKSIERKTDIPELPEINQYHHYVPVEMIFLTDILIGGDVHSSEHHEIGKVRYVPNLSKFHLTSQELTEENNLLLGICKNKEDEVLDELKLHPAFITGIPAPPFVVNDDVLRNKFFDKTQELKNDLQLLIKGDYPYWPWNVNYQRELMERRRARKQKLLQ